MHEVRLGNWLHWDNFSLSALTIVGLHSAPYRWRLLAEYNDGAAAARAQQEDNDLDRVLRAIDANVTTWLIVGDGSRVLELQTARWQGKRAVIEERIGRRMVSDEMWVAIEKDVGRKIERNEAGIPIETLQRLEAVGG